MDREGFRNRMKQYRLAREENPGLKYWEWKDIPKYDEGTGSVIGLSSTTSADGRTKYVYYDPTMDLEYQNINLPEVTITGNKNAGKRLPMLVPEGSYKRFKTLGEIGKTVGGFLPIAGEMIDTYDLATDIKNKDWTNTAIRVGSYFVPNVFEKGAKIIKQGVKNLRKHPKINIDTAYEITDKQWDRAYSKALQDNNLKELQRLRDLHFLAKTNTTVKDASGMPIRTYHTVADKYDSNFTEFNPDIEGSHSAIYTSNDEIMSGSYTNKYVSEKELLAKYPNLKEKGWVKDFSEMIPYYLDYNLWHPERLKSLYINLQHPLTIDADSHNWNYIPAVKLPADVYENINNLPQYMSTRDIEKIYKHFGYDGAVINNVRDYGGGKIIDTEFTPHTVYEIDNPTLLKSADAITYDDSGKVIPLSKRDDRKKKDFRYSWIIPAALSSTTINSDLKAMYAEGGEVTDPPTYEQWYNDITQYNPTILDDASLYWSIEAAKKDLHKQAMSLPGYAPMWHEYVRSLPKADPDIDQFVDDLWANENPNNAGYRNGKYYPHKSPEGGKMTIGPGFKLDSGSHGISTKTANRGMTKTRLDQEARKIGKQHLKAVDQFLNYGLTTNPADTVSPLIKMGLMDLRHQVGPLNEWGNLREAVLTGDLDKIKKESTVTWKDNGKTKVDKRRKKIRDEKYFYYE